MALTARELADRSACSVERIEELVGLGILVSHDKDGPFTPKDVHRVRLMQAFEDAGIDLDLIARGVAAGKVSYENLGLYLPEPAALSQTAEELAVEVGRSPNSSPDSCGSSASPSRSPTDGCARTRSPT